MSDLRKLYTMIRKMLTIEKLLAIERRTTQKAHVDKLYLSRAEAEFELIFKITTIDLKTT